MASQPVDFLSGLGGIGALPHPYDDQQQVVQDQQRQQLGAQAIQQNQQALAQQQAAQQQQQQFHSDVMALGDNPTPAATAGLIRKYPEFAKQLSDAHNIQDEAKRDADFKLQSQIYAAAQNGRYDLASSLLKSHRDASVKAGEPADPSDEAIITALDSGDPAEQKRALSMIGLSVASINPDKFSETYKVLNPAGDDQSTVVGPGGALVRKATGEVLYKSADKPERPVEVPIYDADGHRIGTQLVPLSGGGGPASSGGAPVSGRTVGGWTPRARNGGDNPDDAVDNKIAGVAQALGIDPDADISTLPPAKIAQALAFGEGGTGSLADRNKNPTNIRNPDGSYKTFPNTQAAIQAASGLVAKKIAGGQTSIRTLIEGLPADSKGAANPPGYFGPQGGSASAASVKAGDISTVPANMRAAVQAITDGRSAPPRPGTRNGEAILDVVAAYDPTFDAANANSRVKTRVDFTSGKSAQNITAMNTAMGHLLHLDDLAHDLNNFSTLPGFLNPIYNAGREAAGNTDLGKFEQTKQAASSELRKVFAGSSGGNLEELRQFEANLSSSKSYDQIHAVIQNAVELLGSRLSALQDQYAQGMGRSDRIPTFIKPSIIRDADKRFGVDLGSPTPDATPKAPDGPVQVKTRAEALALPPGTPFLDPQGHHRVRP